MGGTGAGSGSEQGCFMCLKYAKGLIENKGPNERNIASTNVNNTFK